MVVLEGTYWKRKLESITNEYKKWREFSRKTAKQLSMVSFVKDRRARERERERERNYYYNF